MAGVVKRRQLSQLNLPTIQKRSAPDNDRIGLLATYRFEGGIDLGASVGVVDLDLQPHGTSGIGHFL